MLRVALVEKSSGCGLDRLSILLSVGLLGASAVMTQLAVMRELLCVFNGNELVLGIILGNWLLLTGLGSWLGGKSDQLKNPQHWLVRSQILIGLLPLGQVVAIRALRNVLFLPGAMPGLTETVVSSFVLLLPFCVVSGFMLALACSVLARVEGESSSQGQGTGALQSAGSIGQIYVGDTLGSIGGGILFSFILVKYFDHFGLLCVPALLNFWLAGWVGFRIGSKLWAGLASVLSAGLLAVICLVDVDGWSTGLQYPQQRIVFRGNSPYGKLVVTESAGQLNFLQNGLRMFSSHNLDEVEETVHYAMAQRPEAAQVLLVSGGISGAAREILKYSVSGVTYVELDPLLLEAGRKFLPESVADAKIKVVNTDGRLFINQTTERFDVMIVDLPEPSTSQLNRFFTAEFFAASKRALARNGVLSFALGRYENYIGPELARLLATTQSTLKQSFANVLVLPGGRIFFLASDDKLETDIAARLEARQIPTQWVNRHYLKTMFAADRLADVRQAAAAEGRVNKDFSPVLYYYQFLYWLSHFRFRLGLLEGILLLCLAGYLVRLRGVRLTIFASGFAASALEVVLLLGFQILCGSLYYELGVIVTMFMAGLAVGGIWMNRKLKRTTDEHRRARIEASPHPALSPSDREREQPPLPPPPRRVLAKLAFGIALFAGALPWLLEGLLRIENTSFALTSFRIAIAGLTFVLAMLVGAEFPLAGAIEFKQPAATAARIYTADLVGACLGALLASTLLIPVIGLPATCLVTAGLNIIGGVAVLGGKSN